MVVLGAGKGRAVGGDDEQVTVRVDGRAGRVPNAAAALGGRRVEDRLTGAVEVHADDPSPVLAAVAGLCCLVRLNPTLRRSDPKDIEQVQMSAGG